MRGQHSLEEKRVLRCVVDDQESGSMIHAAVYLRSSKTQAFGWETMSARRR